jgi:hypothetical protein
MAIPFALSKDGIEMQFATNHVGMHSVHLTAWLIRCVYGFSLFQFSNHIAMYSNLLGTKRLCCCCIAMYSTGKSSTLT